jgi:hypothetical protein
MGYTGKNLFGRIIWHIGERINCLRCKVVKPPADMHKANCMSNSSSGLHVVYVTDTHVSSSPAMDFLYDLMLLLVSNNLQLDTVATQDSKMSGAQGGRTQHNLDAMQLG